ncbi:MAG: TonB-dependent receptor [Flavobacteriales bacterium]
MPIIARRIVLFLTLVCGLGVQAWSQRPAGMPSIGRVFGKVLDASTGKPAEFATVTVYSTRKDSLLNGTTVRPNGDFALDNLPFGPLTVKVSFIGYKTLVQEVTLTRDRMESDLGNLLLEVDAALLKEFEVTGEQRTMVMQVDRRVFNVDKDLSIQGGSAVDVMKNIPGLSVDIDGNVEMRGSNPQILIDGRPTALLLDQIPAEDIERVELITNPSAAFDANSTGGS